MIDEQRVIWACEKQMTHPDEPGLMFKKIHAQRYEDGWYVICMIYKHLRYQYGTIAAHDRMKRKLTIIGEFFVDGAGEIRIVDHCRDVPPVDAFGDHQFEYTKSKLFSKYEEMKTFLMV